MSAKVGKCSTMLNWYNWQIQCCTLKKIGQLHGRITIRLLKCGDGTQMVLRVMWTYQLIPTTTNWVSVELWMYFKRQHHGLLLLHLL